jgi:hypothetical protein
LGSAKAPTSARAAPGSHSAFASENATFSPRLAHGGVLRADLAAAGEFQDEIGAGLSGLIRRRVRAAVARDDQLQQLARVVERKRVLDLGGDHRLLVVGSDNQG